MARNAASAACSGDTLGGVIAGLAHDVEGTVEPGLGFRNALQTSQGVGIRKISTIPALFGVVANFGEMLQGLIIDSEARCGSRSRSVPVRPTGADRAAPGILAIIHRPPPQLKRLFSTAIASPVRCRLIPLPAQDSAFTEQDAEPGERRVFRWENGPASNDGALGGWHRFSNSR
jgi:hypothetical protein